MKGAKNDGVFANCENQWCQQQAVYFVQYTLCESVTNWGKTCNNPKIDGNRETDPIGLPIWTRQVDVEEWCGQLGGTHDSHTLGTRTGYSVLWNTASSAPGDGYWYPVQWEIELKSRDHNETRMTMSPASLVTDQVISTMKIEKHYDCCKK